MWCHLILALVLQQEVLQQELRYFIFIISMQDELLSALKIMTFLPMLPSVNEHFERKIFKISISHVMLETSFI